MDSFGVSFIPGENAQGTRNNAREGSPSGLPPVQQAIQLLSLRLPRVLGANALAPGPLLNAPGGMGQFGARLNGTADNPMLQALLHLAGLATPLSRVSPIQAPPGADNPNLPRAGDRVEPTAPALSRVSPIQAPRDFDFRRYQRPIRQPSDMWNEIARYLPAAQPPMAAPMPRFIPPAAQPPMAAPMPRFIPGNVPTAPPQPYVPTAPPEPYVPPAPPEPEPNDRRNLLGGNRTDASSDWWAAPVGRWRFY